MLDVTYCTVDFLSVVFYAVCAMAVAFVAEGIGGHVLQVRSSTSNPNQCYYIVTSKSRFLYHNRLQLSYFKETTAYDSLCRCIGIRTVKYMYKFKKL